jgi:hypothetical protein
MKLNEVSISVLQWSEGIGEQVVLQILEGM